MDANTSENKEETKKKGSSDNKLFAQHQALLQQSASQACKNEASLSSQLPVVWSDVAYAGVSGAWGLTVSAAVVECRQPKQAVLRLKD